MAAPDGLLVVDKPSGLTSHDVVARCRRLAATRKVGHAGTLDPMATGLLLLGIGRATRLLGHLALATKGYDATIRLGQTTVTDDAEGEPVKACDATAITRSDLEFGINGLRGDIQQVPSAVSAIKVKGVRSYHRVREGEHVALPPRAVHVSAFNIHGVRRSGALVDVDVSVACSSGTYIRALARDLGSALGVGGHLTALRRTSVGGYDVRQAATLAVLAALPPEALPVIGLDRAAADNFTSCVVGVNDVTAVRNGRALSVQLTESPSKRPVALLAPGGELLALYEQHGPLAKAVAVFAPS